MVNVWGQLLHGFQKKSRNVDVRDFLLFKGPLCQAVSQGPTECLGVEGSRGRGNTTDHDTYYWRYAFPLDPYKKPKLYKIITFLWLRD